MVRDFSAPVIEHMEKHPQTLTNPPPFLIPLFECPEETFSFSTSSPSISYFPILFFVFVRDELGADTISDFPLDFKYSSGFPLFMISVSFPICYFPAFSFGSKTFSNIRFYSDLLFSGFALVDRDRRLFGLT